MTFLSLFSGCGGLDRAIPGRCLAHVEWNTYAQRVLRRHWPDVPVLGDVREVNGSDFRGVDLVVGGPPCQAASHAGLQLGEADPRWMWPEAVRIVRETETPAFYFENVPGLLTLNAGRSFGAILSALTALGYFVRWDCCTAAEVGRPHLRDRVWIAGTRTPGPRGWMSVPIPQVKKWPRAGWAWEGRTGEDVARWPKRDAWPLVAPGVCPPAGEPLWITPGVEDGGRNGDAAMAERWERGERIPDTHHRLRTQALMGRLWPTPKASDEGDRGLSVERREAGVVDGLRVAAKLWPTPSGGCFNDAEDIGAWQARRARVQEEVGNGNGFGMPIGVAARLWPTPDANCAKGSQSLDQRRGQLTEATVIEAGRPVQPPLDAGDAAWEAYEKAASDYEEAKPTGRLNPAWVETLLLGWPLGWTLPDGPSLAHEPAPPRDVEIATRLTMEKQHRRDRLRLTGNGVVTETAALVYAALLG